MEAADRMDLGLAGRAAIVTAASRGLGRACAMRLALEGADVAICARDEAALMRTAEEIRKASGREVLAMRADVSQAGDIRALVDAAARRFGRIDALICNAGGPPSGSFLDMTDEHWEAAVQLNLMSVIRLIRETVPHMRRAGGGRIVNISSVAIKQPIPGLVLSNTLRAGLHGLVKTLANELAPAGILVNTLCPGRFETDRIVGLDRATAEREGIPVEEVRRRSESSIPLGRSGDPEEFARYAAFLASPANSYMTGQAIVVDGGQWRGV
jgi:3-oxoacyl-[acyl-carrier protein] reductase